MKDPSSKRLTRIPETVTRFLGKYPRYVVCIIATWAYAYMLNNSNPGHQVVLMCEAELNIL